MKRLAFAVRDADRPFEPMRRFFACSHANVGTSQKSIYALCKFGKRNYHVPVFKDTAG
jgi:hypothetical protein